METARSAVVAGHICLDIFPNLDHLAEGQFTRLFQPGHLIEAGPATFSTGGPVSNTGLVLHKLGTPTQLMRKIGDDLFGQAVQDIMSSYSPELVEGMIVDPAVNTSYSVIINPPGVDRIFLHNPGANDTFCAEDIDYDKVARASLFHFGYPPIMRRMYADNGVELASIFKRVKESGVITSLDMAFPDPAAPSGRADWREILRATLPYVDIFLPSIEELLFMLYRPTYERLCEVGDILDQITPELLMQVSADLLEMGVKIQVLKLGYQGLYLRTASPSSLSGMNRGGFLDEGAWGNQEAWIPCFQVKVAGTTGSGDATIAGFLSSLLRGLSPYEAMTAAVAVGACNVEAADALSGIRSWEATMERVKAGWPTHKLELLSPGWRWNDQNGVWISTRKPGN